MKKVKMISIIVLALTILAACGQVNNVQPTVTPTIMPELQFTETVNAVTEEPAKFPMLYQNETAAIQFSYPDGWTLMPEQVIGDRGSQAALLSPGSSLEKLADGGSRIVMTTFLWDPKNDLAAFTNQRKAAWEASGFTILNEESVKLGDGRDLMIYKVETAEKTQILIAFANSGGDYLQISGEGDLELCREIFDSIQSIQ
jgi:hypothetical protein